MKRPPFGEGIFLYNNAIMPTEFSAGHARAVRGKAGGDDCSGQSRHKSQKRTAENDERIVQP